MVSLIRRAAPHRFGGESCRMALDEADRHGGGRQRRRRLVQVADGGGRDLLAMSSPLVTIRAF
ncbi:MAG: hypothetical protein ACYCTL_13215 [Acidimicrobiales bacterium]